MTDVVDRAAAGGIPRAPAMRVRWFWVALLVVVLGGASVTVGVVVSRSSGAAPSRVPGLSDAQPDPSQGISGGTLVHTPATFSLSMGTFLCGKGDVAVTSLSLYRPSAGISLTRWGLLNSDPTPNEAGQANGTLNLLGRYDSHTIARHCDSPFYTRVGIQLQRTAPGPQSWLGLRLTYKSAGRKKVGYLWEQYHLR